MTWLANADWELIAEYISEYLDWVQQYPEEVVRMYGGHDQSFLAVISSGLASELQIKIEELLERRVSATPHQFQTLEEQFESLSDKKLQHAIRDIRCQLDVAEMVKAVRGTRAITAAEKVTAFETMKLSELQKLIKEKRAGWELAKEAFLRRLRTQSSKQRPAQEGSKQTGVPYDPEGTEGDWWREHSG